MLAAPIFAHANTFSNKHGNVEQDKLDNLKASHISNYRQQINDKLNNKWFLKTRLKTYESILGNNELYLTVGDIRNTISLISLNAKDGNQNWSYFGNYTIIDFNSTDHLLYVLQDTYNENVTLLAFDEKGTVKWKYKIGLAFDEKGTVKWKYKIGYANIPTITITTSNDKKTIYISSNKNLIALDANGKQKWVYPEAASLPVEANNTVYCVDDKFAHKLFAIDANTGKQKWSYDLDQDIGIIHGGLFVKEDTLYFMVRTHQLTMRVYAFSSDGKLKWRYDDNQYDISSILKIDDHGLYLKKTTLYKNALSLIGFDGTLKWQYETPHDSIDTTHIDKNGFVYFVYENKVYALDPTGKIKWEYKTYIPNKLVGIFNGELYGFGATEDDYVIVSYSLETGAEVVRYQTNADINAYINWMGLTKDTIYYANQEGVGALTVQH